MRGNSIAGHKAQRRPRAGEEWLAVTKHDGMQVESILIDQTEIGEALRQLWSANVNLPGKLSLQPTYRRLKVISDEHGVGADRLQRVRYDPLRLPPPHRREIAFLGNPIRLIFVPIAHDLVQAATVPEACQAAHMINEVTEERETRRKFRMFDVAVQGLVHSKHDLGHALFLPSRAARFPEAVSGRLVEV